MPNIQVELEQGTLVASNMTGSTYAAMKASATIRLRSVYLVKGIGSYTVSVNSGYSIILYYFDSSNRYSGSTSGSWAQTQSGNNANVAICIRKNDDSDILLTDNHGLTVTVQEEYTYWQLDENDILTNEYLPDALPYDYEHKNMSDWYMNANDKIENDIIPVRLNWSPPYPIGKWYLDNNDVLMANGIPERLSLSNGAFADNIHLSFLHIPNSVKTIGSLACSNTALKSVTIASDCDYYTTSFPQDCKIKYY